jgi:hypothetical protein
MTAAAETETRAEQLLALTERLTDVLAIEAAAFEQRRPHEVAAGAAETARLANLYRRESARIKADPSFAGELSPTTRATLIRATEAFEAVLARHGRAVAAARTISEGLVQAIAEEVAATRQARTPYGADARAGTADASAIALNRRA